MKNTLLIFATILFAGALTACGGGGGSSSAPIPPLDTPENRAAFANSAVEIGEPAPGSVVQSTNTDTTSDATQGDISVEIDLSQLRFDVRHTSPVGQNWTVRYGQDDLDDATSGSFNTAIFGTRAGSGHVFVEVAVEVTGGIDPDNLDNAALLAISTQIDNNDWFAYGIWAYVPDSRNVDDFELGIFVDGGNLVSTDVGRTDTAMYEGGALGLLIGESEFLSFNGEVSLMADFNAGNISGKVTSIINAGTNAAIDGFELNLEQADITGGFFTGDLTAAGAGYADITGHWGGNFSHSDTAHAPDYALGTFGGKGATSGANLLGAFFTCRDDASVTTCD